MTVKDETGNFEISTRFGKRRKIYRDKKWHRPKSLDEARQQIEITRLQNNWDLEEFAKNCAALGIEPKPLTDYTRDELARILDDFEKFRMIIYEN